MRFAGMIWRLLVGVKDALVLLFMLLFFGFLYAALTFRPNAGAVREGALLLDMGGTIVEQPAATDPVDLVTGGSSLAREYRLRDIVEGLNRAATDSRIKVVALDLDIFTGGGQTTLGDVGDALERVRRAGKPVLAYASGYTDDSYQLAAHASEIWVNPMGGVLVSGPGRSGLYYKGLLDKLGVTANVYRVGAWKAAVEPYTRSDMSPESREATQALAASLWESWQQDVTQARPNAKAAAYAAQPSAAVRAAGGDLAQAALRAGLVDRIGDRTAFEARLAELAGADTSAAATRPYRHTDLTAWTAAAPKRTGKVGVLTVAGEIVDGEAAAGSAGGDTVAGILARGLAAHDIKALVVRIDSPGGSVLGSERIRQAVLAAKARGIPVVVSMGSVAASGGYWIATAGDSILAEPSTITGSIGVFGVIPSFQGTLEKLGVGADGVKTTPLSGEPDVLRGISPEASAIIQLGVEDSYRRFLSLVSKSRNMPVERAHAIAQGRVWDGGTARQLGLVDRFGSLDEAVAEAARLAKLEGDAARPVYLDRQPGFVEGLFAAASAEESEPAARDIFSRVAARPEQLALQALADARAILSGSAIQARCLECPPVARASSRRGEQSLLDWLWAALQRP